MEQVMDEVIEGEYIPNDDDSVELTDDQILQYTQKTRKQLATAIVSKGMPEDKDDRTVLLQTLRDMDHTAISRKRLDVDNANLENDAMIIDIVSKMQELNPRGRRLRDEDIIPRDVSVDESALVGYEFHEEEKKLGLPKETSKEFLERMDKIMEEES